MWNRQRGDRERVDDLLPGLLQVRKLTAGTHWVISAKAVHPALVSVEDFVAAQAVSAITPPASGKTRTYVLVGLLRCRLCGRSLESQWSHGHPCYRCRHGHTTADQPATRRAANLHLREDLVTARVVEQLQRLTSANVEIERSLDGVLDAGTPRVLAEFLRTHAITIYCDSACIDLEIDSADLTATGAGELKPAVAVKVPRQRSSAADVRSNRRI